MRVKRSHESEEQIAARNAAQRIKKAEILRQESREQRVCDKIYRGQERRENGI